MSFEPQIMKSPIRRLSLSAGVNVIPFTNHIYQIESAVSGCTLEITPPAQDGNLIFVINASGILVNFTTWLDERSINAGICANVFISHSLAWVPQHFQG